MYNHAVSHARAIALLPTLLWWAGIEKKCMTSLLFLERLMFHPAENSVAGSVCPSGFYGNNCRHHCHCKTNDTACVDVTGYCPNGCIDRWSGPTCQSGQIHFSFIRSFAIPYNLSDADVWTRSRANEGCNLFAENVAFRMPSKIRTVTPPTSADYAVDGNVSTCAHSTPNSTGWFQVDLQTTVTVYRIYLVTGTCSKHNTSSKDTHTRSSI